LILFIDTETEPLLPEGKVRTNANPPPLAAWVALLSDGDVHWGYHDDLAPLARLVEQADLLVFHNSPFDLGVLDRAGLPLRAEALAGRVRDTMVMYKLRKVVKSPSSLDAVAWELRRRQMKKDHTRLSFVQGRELSEEQKKYMIEDAYATRMVYDALIKTPLGGLSFHDEEVVLSTERNRALDPDALYSTAYALMAWTGQRGLRIDWKAVERIHEHLERELEDHCEELVKVGLLEVVKESKTNVRPVVGTWDFDKYPRKWTPVPGTKIMRRRQGDKMNPRIEECDGKYKMRQKELRARYLRLAEEQQIEYETTPTGSISLSYKFWKQYKGDLTPDLLAHLAYAKAQKLLSAFTSPLLSVRPTEKVYPKYWIPGAETGRWGCSNPNAMQLPRSLRPMYIPEDGHVFVSADYKALEMYTLADSMASMGIRGALMDTLETEGDNHEITASKMFRVPVESVTPTQRQDAKMVNFGLAGGMGVATLLRHARAQGADWDVDYAQAVRAAWFETYPDVEEYLSRLDVDPYEEFKPQGVTNVEWLRALGLFQQEDDPWPSRHEIIGAINDGKIFTVILPSGRILPQREYSAAANAFLQGPGADTITVAYIECMQEGLDVSAVVHDSITVQSEKDCTALTGGSLTRIMAAALTKVCPFVPVPTPEFKITEHLV
jgi:DNA polymerase I-like protein with 3'-5' exonuclease and polymerase domains